MRSYIVRRNGARDVLVPGLPILSRCQGAKGKYAFLILILKGRHDDPINIHGTHLKVMEYVSDKQVRVRFMHGQSYGFEAFYKGDEVEFVDAHSLRCLQPARVKAVERIDDYEILLTLDRA